MRAVRRAISPRRPSLRQLTGARSRIAALDKALYTSPRRQRPSSGGLGRRPFAAPMMCDKAPPALDFFDALLFPSSSGQDATLSRWRPGFDSPWERQFKANLRWAIILPRSSPPVAPARLPVRFIKAPTLEQDGTSARRPQALTPRVCLDWIVRVGMKHHCLQRSIL